MKVYLRTYGCRANQYDTEAVRSMLRASGIEEADRPDDADVAIFNSCTVTASAEADLRSDVRRAHETNPILRTVVMGCAAAVPYRDESRSPLATLPGVEAVVPAADLEMLALHLGLAKNTLTTTQTGARALLRIQDGCDEHCTFCATTISRGANKSRSVEELINEATQLSRVHPEIVLTGIHIGTYGRDIGQCLSDLVEALVVQVPTVRFRLSSVEATEVDDRLIDLMSALPRRVAPHLHAPLQSGSDRVLKRMGRHWYTSKSYRESIEKIASRVSPFALSGDVIVGFPGETSEDHDATLQLIDSLPFTALHVFPYSSRPGTAATKLGPTVDGATARRRASELRNLAAAKAASHSASRIGSNADIVMIERGKGLTEDYLSVSVTDFTIPRRARFDALLGDDNGILTVTQQTSG